MRRLLMCGAALCASCGSPTGAFLGSYTVAGDNGSRTINGITTQFGTVADPGLKLLITHPEKVGKEPNVVDATPDWIDVTVGGQKLLSAHVTSGTTADTLEIFPPTTSDPDCLYNLHFVKGSSNVTLQSSVLQITLSGSITAFCSSPQGNAGTGTITETLQATKDN